MNTKVRNDGTYRVTLEPGNYVITIEAMPEVSIPAGMSPEEIDDSQIPPAPVHPGYGNKKVTPLKCEVKVGQENIYNIRM